MPGARGPPAYYQGRSKKQRRYEALQARNQRVLENGKGGGKGGWHVGAYPVGGSTESAPTKEPKTDVEKAQCMDTQAKLALNGSTS